jgi:hypothetical protein
MAMKNNHMSCLKQTLVFITGLVVGGILISINPSPNVGINEAFIIILTGSMFHLGQQISFNPSTNRLKKNK